MFTEHLIPADASILPSRTQLFAGLQVRADADNRGRNPRPRPLRASPSRNVGISASLGRRRLGSVRAGLAARLGRRRAGLLERVRVLAASLGLRRVSPCRVNDGCLRGRQRARMHVGARAFGWSSRWWVALAQQAEKLPKQGQAWHTVTLYIAGLFPIRKQASAPPSDRSGAAQAAASVAPHAKLAARELVYARGRCDTRGRHARLARARSARVASRALG